MTSQPPAEDTREIPRNDKKTDAYYPHSIVSDGNGNNNYPSSFAKKKKTRKKQKRQTKVPASNNAKDDYELVTKLTSSSSSTSTSSTSSSPSSSSSPSKFRVHGALFTVQVIFGISAVVGSIGLPRFHPLTFALYRESSAAILLSFGTYWCYYLVRPSSCWD